MKNKEKLPLLVIEATGELVKSNFDDFNAAASEWLAAINRNLRTDEDFEQANSDAKKAKEVEEMLSETHKRILEQAESVNAELGKITALSERMRNARLYLTKEIDKAKSEQRARVIDAGIGMIQCDNSLRETFRPLVESAVKGCKSLDSMRDKIRVAVDLENSKIEKAKTMLGEFEQANGRSLTMDRTRLELLDVSALTPELRLRLEKAQSEAREKKLREEMAEAAEAARKAVMEAAETVKPVESPKPEPEPVNDLPWDTGTKPAQETHSELLSQEAEWLAYESTLGKALTEVRVFRAHMIHPANLEKAEAVAKAMQEAYNRIVKGGAK